MCFSVSRGCTEWTDSRFEILQLWWILDSLSVFHPEAALEVSHRHKLASA